MYRYTYSLISISSLNYIQIKTLAKSLFKWINIYEGETVDNGAKDCECCIIYDKTTQCRNCPIAIKTGNHNCIDTPYTII